MRHACSARAHAVHCVASTSDAEAVPRSTRMYVGRLVFAYLPASKVSIGAAGAEGAREVRSARAGEGRGGANCEVRIARGARRTRGRAGARGAKCEAHGVAPPVLGEGRRFEGPLVRAARNTQGLPERSTVETTVTSAGRKSFAMATPEGKWPPKLPRRSMSSSSADASGSAASTRSTDS